MCCESSALTPSCLLFPLCPLSFAPRSLRLASLPLSSLTPPSSPQQKCQAAALAPSVSPCGSIANRTCVCTDQGFNASVVPCENANCGLEDGQSKSSFPIPSLFHGPFSISLAKSPYHAQLAYAPPSPRDPSIPPLRPHQRSKSVGERNLHRH